MDVLATLELAVAEAEGSAFGRDRGPSGWEGSQHIVCKSSRKDDPLEAFLDDGSAPIRAACAGQTGCNG